MHGKLFVCPKCGGQVVVDTFVRPDVTANGISCPLCGEFIQDGKLVDYILDYGDGVGDLDCNRPMVQGNNPDITTAQLLEGAGVLNTDGYLHIGKDDVLVLRTDKMLIPSHREEFEKNMSEKLGIKVVLIDRVTEVVGVVEHGA